MDNIPIVIEKLKYIESCIEDDNSLFFESVHLSQKDIDDGSYIYALIKNMNILAIKISDQLYEIPNNLESICSYELKVDVEMSDCAFRVLSYLKVLVEEHKLLPKAIDLISRGKIEIIDGRVNILK